MHRPEYYRHRAARLRDVANFMIQESAVDLLECVATDLEEIATDLDRGAVEVTHPSRLPQQQ